MSSSTLNLAELVQRAQQFVRTAEEQQRAEEAAEQRGIQFALEIFAKYAPEIWEAGRADMEREVNAAWTAVAERSHFLGSTASRTYAENRAEEIERLKPRPNDFPGLENDPRCLDPIRASVERIAHDNHQRAA